MICWGYVNLDLLPIAVFRWALWVSRSLNPKIPCFKCCLVSWFIQHSNCIGDLFTVILVFILEHAIHKLDARERGPSLTSIHHALVKYILFSQVCTQLSPIFAFWSKFCKLQKFPKKKMSYRSDFVYFELIPCDSISVTQGPPSPVQERLLPSEVDDFGTWDCKLTYRFLRIEILRFKD